MGPEMGHRRRLDDGNAVAAVVGTVLGLAADHVFPGEVEWLRDLHERRIEAASFDAHFRLQMDRLDWRTEEARTMIVVRFAPAGQPLPTEPWALRARGTWVARQDRLPDGSFFSSKRLRRPDQRRRRKTDRRSADEPLAVPWGRHDNLWIWQATDDKDVEVQTADLKAQVALFLLQIGLVPSNGSVRDALIAYLRRTFRWRGIDDPETAVFGVHEHLLTHKWWLDDWRAWRKLVRACIDGEAKKRSHRAAIDPDLTPDDDGNLTVDQFALACGMPRSKAYGLVRTGKVHVTRREEDGRLLIPVSEINRPPELRRQDVIRKTMEHRQVSYAAARKWVYRSERSGMTLNQIADRVRDLSQC